MSSKTLLNQHACLSVQFPFRKVDDRLHIFFLSQNPKKMNSINRIRLSDVAPLFAKLGVDASQKHAVAVNGSPESMLLAYFLHETLGSEHLLALTFDHQLNKTSGQVVDRIQSQCNRLGTF